MKSIISDLLRGPGAVSPVTKGLKPSLLPSSRHNSTAANADAMSSGSLREFGSIRTGSFISDQRGGCGRKIGPHPDRIRAVELYIKLGNRPILAASMLSRQISRLRTSDRSCGAAMTMAIDHKISFNWFATKTAPDGNISGRLAKELPDDWPPSTLLCRYSISR